MNGLFISLEGIDGCGKSTQGKLLAEFLREQGHTVYLTKNPGDTDLGEELRHILLHTKAAVHARAELLLYVADRTQHWFEHVLPHLEAGNTVICDRYIDSTIAYQGYGRGESIAWIEALHDNALATPARSFWPDVTLWFDAPVAVCLDRVQTRQGYKDRLEQENQAFYLRVQQGFLAQAKRDNQRFHCLDATQSINTLAETVKAILLKT
jgi:dTMP kinase